MKKTKAPKFFNRELSWVEFNNRVLAQTHDENIPLLERVKFLAITAGNLDEFFMVRVGGLQSLVDNAVAHADNAGLRPAQQLARVRAKVREHVDEQYAVLRDSLEPALEAAGIRRLASGDLDGRLADHYRFIFLHDILPVLSPIGFVADMEPPLLANRMLHCAVRLKGRPGDPAGRFAVIPLPKALPRFISQLEGDELLFVLLEDLVICFVADLFPGETVLEVAPFRVTRNADMSVREDLAGDLLSSMEDVIDARRRSDCVRLEIGREISPGLRGFLCDLLGAEDTQIFAVNGPLDLSAYMSLRDAPGFDGLRFESWALQPSPAAPPGSDMFSVIAKRNVLLHHPYESFEPVVRLIEQAADDEFVVAIKQILYRTSRNSPIVAALKRAAESGKYVTVLMELKARFDEERNIGWARELEDVGVQVIYGVKGFKTHAKVCIIVRKEDSGLKRYVHFGTGNYNEVTAQMYTDVSWMTCNEDLAADASSFFNVITARTEPTGFRKLSMAPVGLRESLLEHIATEIERKRQGHKARIIAKMNSLVDTLLIEALYQASQAGVEVSLIVRGICCLVPGVPGLSENISVLSIIDRYLEHSRIFHFHNGGDPQVFISSADWMPRNLDKRLELLVPVEDAAAVAKLGDILTTSLRDTDSAWLLSADGSYAHVQPQSDNKRLRSQDAFHAEAVAESSRIKKLRRTVFEPHTRGTKTNGA